jgi:organic hydroperoxide reductase OsmC/OhrA
MSIVKTHRFPVDVHWVGGRLTRASAHDKPDLQVATPPEFRGGIAGVWSPEDLLVASLASCYTVTLVAIAEARRVPLLSLDVRGVGHLEKREDGRFGFVAIELAVEVETEPGSADDVEFAAEKAEQGCLVAAALDVPVHAEIKVRETATAPVAV